MNTSLVRLLVVSGALALAAAASAQQSFIGNIRAVRVTGEVNAIPAGDVQVAVPVVDGQILNQGLTVQTGANGRVILLFSSGATMILRPGSTLAIDEFVQEAFSGEARRGAQEPSVSRTRVTLESGSLINNIRRLRSTSEYSIRTPLGAAGVRGTNLFQSAGQNGTSATSQLTVETGSVNWDPNFPDTSDRLVTVSQTLRATGQLDANGNVVSYQDSIVTESVDFLKEIADELATVDDLWTNPDTIPTVPTEPVGGTVPVTPGSPPDTGVPPGTPTILTPGGLVSPA